MVWIIVIAIVVLIVLWIFATQNKLVRKRMKAENAFADIDVHLVKRYDLIPNIVNTVKGYAKHEKETLEKVISLRNSAYENMSDEEKIKANEQLTSGINKIMALAEAYPDLKANENFKDLSNQLTKVEEDIANSRKYYNGVVRIYNDKVKMFPSNIFAGLFGYKAKKMFETAAAERENIKVEF